jgi:hypothetical protein
MKRNVLHSTKDYSKFELCQFNRSVEKTKFLRESMKKHGFISAYPIHCNSGEAGRLLIKAGHHRFEVAQELGLAVFYVVTEDAATIHELEKATTRWSLYDYMESFAKCGSDAYAKVKEYHERTGIPLQQCISMLGGESAGSGNQAIKFKHGDFKLAEWTHAGAVADVVLHCKDLGIKANDSIFVQTLSRCMFVPEFSPEIFKLRAASNVARFKPCRLVAEQIALFEEIYNMKARNENRLPLMFLANKAMTERMACKKKV